MYTRQSRTRSVARAMHVRSCLGRGVRDETTREFSQLPRSSTSAIESMLRDQTQWLKRASHAEFHAALELLNYYRQEFGAFVSYAELNAALRRIGSIADSVTDVVKDIVKDSIYKDDARAQSNVFDVVQLFDTLFDNVPRLREPLVLYRGLPACFDPEGTQCAYSSTSLSPLEAHWFGDRVAELHVPAGARVLCFDAFDFVASSSTTSSIAAPSCSFELEVLLPRGVSFARDSSLGALCKFDGMYKTEEFSFSTSGPFCVERFAVNFKLK